MVRTKISWFNCFLLYCSELEKDDYIENVHVLSCFVLSKSVLLISCVFWIFFQNAGSQLCFRFLFWFFVCLWLGCSLGLPLSSVYCCIFTSGLNNCFTICAQNVSFSRISFAVHFVRNILRRFWILIVFNPPSSQSKLSTFLLIFSKALLFLLYFLFHKNLYTIVLMRVS